MSKSTQFIQSIPINCNQEVGSNHRMSFGMMDLLILERTSTDIEEIDVAQADQSDSWETDDEGDFYTEPSNGRLSDHDEDDNLLGIGLSKQLIACYPIATAEEISLVGVVCDICLNEYKTNDKIRTINCLNRFHTR